MSETREFDLSDILSVSTGRLVSTRHMDGVYDVMGFLMRDPYISTIGLAMCAERCKAAILAQHPQLADVNACLHYFDLTDADQRRAWLAAQRQQFGDSLALAPIPDAHGGPTLDEQVAEVLSINPAVEFLTVAAPPVPTPEP